MTGAPGSISDVIKNAVNTQLAIPVGLDGGPPSQAVPRPQESQSVQPVQSQQVQSQQVQTRNVLSAQVAAEDSVSVELPTFEDVADAAQEIERPVEQVDDDSDLPEEPSAVNFKKLRESRKEERRRLRELEAQMEETRTRLEKYEKGEVMPEVIQAKDQRIQELEKYERAVNLKMSREYQETFVLPAQTLKAELEKLGEEYGLPAEYMHQAVNIENRRELNAFLSQHFDDIGALEVKRIISDLHDLGSKAQQAEQEPVEVLEQLRSQFIQKEQNEQRTRAKTFESVAKSAWEQALEKTKNENVYKELILSDTDPEWNKTVVQPIQAKASQQFGALVTQLHKNGLKVLPVEVATGLARTIQLAIAGAMSLNQKNKAQIENSQIKKATTRLSPYLKPSIGGNNGSGNTSRANHSESPKNPKEASQRALQNLKR